MFEKKYKNEYNYNIVFNKLISYIILCHTYPLLYGNQHIGMTSNQIIINMGEKKLYMNE